MAPTYHITPSERVPDGARVCHFDELDEPAKERLPGLVGGAGATTTDRAFEATARRCDVVKFTDYYRIERRS